MYLRFSSLEQKDTNQIQEKAFHILAVSFSPMDRTGCPHITSIYQTRLNDQITLSLAFTK